jgi:shikimate dehydrogenase
LPSLEILAIEMDESASLVQDLHATVAMPVSSRALSDQSLAETVPTADLIVHATPVGMSPHVTDSLIPPHLLAAHHVVFDIVYNPLETRLLRDAHAAGSHVVSGLGMFVYQAAIQFELWTGLGAPVDAMTQSVRSTLGGDT